MSVYFGSMRKSWILVHVTKQELRDARRIGDKIMCSGLHEDYWLKQYRKARAKGLLESPFYGDWTMIPRGRIFYDIPTQTFVCYVGKWYKKYERILRDLILIEFDIPKESFRFQYDRHWDIGHGWSERGL